MSLELSHYFRLRAVNTPVAEAAETAGLLLREAELWEEAVARGEASFSQGENEMARGNDKTKVEEVHAPDFAKMKRIFLTDLKPAEEKNAKSRGDLSAAWGAIEKDCHCNKRAAKLLFKLNNESEETRDDFLRTLYGGMQALDIGISADLVDKMSDQDAPTMPTVAGKGLGQDNLATLGSRPDPDAAAFDNAEEPAAAA